MAIYRYARSVTVTCPDRHTQRRIMRSEHKWGEILKGRAGVGPVDRRAVRPVGGRAMLLHKMAIVKGVGRGVADKELARGCGREGTGGG